MTLISAYTLGLLTPFLIILLAAIVGGIKFGFGSRIRIKVGFTKEKDL